MDRNPPTRFRFVDSDEPRIRLVYLPLLALALVLELARPLPFLPEDWIGHLLGWPLLLAAAGYALTGEAAPGEPVFRVRGRLLVRRRVYLALAVAVVALALIGNSLWPLIMLAAGTVLVIRLLAAQGPGWVDRRS